MLRLPIQNQEEVISLARRSPWREGDQFPLMDLAD